MQQKNKIIKIQKWKIKLVYEKIEKENSEITNSMSLSTGPALA